MGISFLSRIVEFLKFLSHGSLTFSVNFLLFLTVDLINMIWNAILIVFLAALSLFLYFFSPFSGAKIAFEITVTRVYVHSTCYADYKHTHQLYVYRHLAYTIECSDECTGINLINRHIAY